MIQAYQIAAWDRHFENNKSRERDRCAFVCLPNKQDGLGLARILAHKHGAAIYGVWCLMVGACSRQARPRAGWLTDDGTATGRAWLPEDMALRWRRPLAEIRRALEALSAEGVKWLVPAECPPSARPVPAECPSGALERKGREGKGKEGKTDLRTGTGARFSEDRFERELWQHYPNKRGKAGAVKGVRRLIGKGIATWGQLRSCVERYAAECRGKEPRYILHGSTFFGPAERWSDYLGGSPEALDAAEEIERRRERQNAKQRAEAIEQEKQAKALAETLARDKMAPGEQSQDSKRRAAREKIKGGAR